MGYCGFFVGILLSARSRYPLRGFFVGIFTAVRELSVLVVGFAGCFVGVNTVFAGFHKIDGKGRDA